MKMNSDVRISVSDNDDDDNNGSSTTTNNNGGLGSSTNTPAAAAASSFLAGTSTPAPSPTSPRHSARPASTVYVAYPRPVTQPSGTFPYVVQPLMPSTVGRHNGFLRTYKVLVVGEAGVGKSNLMHRYCLNQYDPSLPSTIGVEFCAREVDIPSGPAGQTESVVLQLWDTAGQECNAGVISNAFYRNAVGAVVVYDVTRRESLLNVPRWVARVNELAREECVCVVVGAKVDLLRSPQGAAVAASALETLRNEADRISHALGTRNFLTSALSGEGVLEAFTHLVLAVDAVQAAPPLESLSHDFAAHKYGGGGLPPPPRTCNSGLEMWTVASTVPASPVTLFGSPTSHRLSEAGLSGGHGADFTGPNGSTMTSANTPLSLSQHPLGMTPSPSGYVPPLTVGSVAHLRSSCGTPARQKKVLDLRGFGRGEKGMSPAPTGSGGGVYGNPSQGC